MEHDFAILFVVTMILSLLRLLPEFRIWVTQVSVECTGTLLHGHETAVTYFFRSVLDYQGQLKITGRQTARGTLKLRFQGDLSDADRQRFRNFLLALLRR